MRRPMGDTGSGWCGTASLRFARGQAGTRHQGGATAPLKVQRTFQRADGRCELPILHTAGGLVGGDRLSISADLQTGSRALLTSVAAQKVYGSIGRSRRAPAGRWARQELSFRLEEGADLEWLPQELVLYAGGLFEQHARVILAPGASWLGGEVVRLGRTAAGEDLGEGRWRSLLEIRRHGVSAAADDRWELVDRLELSGAALEEAHGMAGQPVFGSLVWAAPQPLAEERMRRLLELCRSDRGELEGEMACGALEQGLVARYRGRSSTAARHWFVRLWARIRAEQGLSPPPCRGCGPSRRSPCRPVSATPPPEPMARRQTPLWATRQSAIPGPRGQNGRGDRLRRIPSPSLPQRRCTSVPRKRTSS